MVAANRPVTGRPRGLGIGHRCGLIHGEIGCFDEIAPCRVVAALTRGVDVFRGDVKRWCKINKVPRSTRLRTAPGQRWQERDG